MEILEHLGTMPLPPYIHEKLRNQEMYQTVYAKDYGSAAAPTAGLHFTNELLDKIAKMGVKIVHITLHVGLGTFRPVMVDDIKNHVMHSEHFIISKEAADTLNKVRESGKKIIAVPRLAKYGEHVDDHQIQLIKQFDELNFLEPCYELDDLKEILKNSLKKKSTT